MSTQGESANLGMFLGRKKLCKGDFEGGIYLRLALPSGPHIFIGEVYALAGR